MIPSLRHAVPLALCVCWAGSAPAQTAAVPAPVAATPPVRVHFTEEILTFFRHCRDCRSPASTVFAQSYLTGVGRGRPWARMALLWFFRAAQSAAPEPKSTPPPAGTPPAAARARSQEARRDVPAPAARDLGGADWERDLILAAYAEYEAHASVA